ncbi:4-(cytidine 5'-diphospho)-2-C-methyl-D-erythritol kinase [Helicobacter ailurogastricus]|uniref:4-(cytidine 5'-diphospho)-2-C-methyl-D-erythritol kinase n=1 Tax=Helicobacter ailurogastricus TaxID=1578720 RepID=UPI001F30A505|nr:4-(cytidine 5'-diphospho)-2-C-methyl-D-erythritol kinase [Helicobacter ailurogastricus]GLH58179.1 4-diphosphocytidyl-2-C-methyl-D-erythritol kinase IspE [Helicobacter ailurogastricus]GLH59085.1 4-diphosphocytidyl-2-C-methyl-D-erythritol kinase IspE [Helicobacter ailurogastricus]GMB89510.1 4-diphosphocytidyl-2-C-methyl-D-erythritol kinase IspE [Helicobacter ailurogastricus]GMB91400.1 4-diphosphocytidyl-2-C-methyl-D-erythritol kinase IspE [Helicobacter ailurogastricus]
MNLFSCLVYPKINVFLKIVGKSGGYHLLNSRLCLVRGLHDVLCVKSAPKFSLKGDFDCPLAQNTLYKAWWLLKERLKPALRSRVEGLQIEVQKQIPAGGGLGGGSADAGVFLREVNRHLDLGLDLEQLYQIGAQVGADVNFFISGFSSANVSHFGQIVQDFKEEPLEVKLSTPPLKCVTAKVYQAFKTPTAFNPAWASKTSPELLKAYTAQELNDLYTPALSLYPALKEHAKSLDQNYLWFFSGSGSSFFGLKGDA